MNDFTQQLPGPSARPERRILLVDDDAASRATLSRDVAPRARRVREATTRAEALRALRAERFDLIIVNHALEAGCGVDLLAQAREGWPATARVLIASGDDAAVARDAVNRGGVSYLLRSPLVQTALDDVLARCAPPAREIAPTLPESLRTLERRHIIETLERVGWNKRRAAGLLQISTTTLWRRLKAFGINRRPGPAIWAGSP